MNNTANKNLTDKKNEQQATQHTITNTTQDNIKQNNKTLKNTTQHIDLLYLDGNEGHIALCCHSSGY